jgi:hypothetical protein
MNYFQTYAKKMVNNLPRYKRSRGTKHMLTLDVILDGGAFNGSYLLGVMYFLREMKSQQRLELDRISCSSIGTFVALAHMGDCMDLFSTILYKKTRRHFKTHMDLNNFDETFEELRKHLPSNICERMSGKVFMSYYNIKKGKKIVKSRFHTVDDIFETIRRSCFVPFFINGNATYKNKYMDGLNPYFFNKMPTTPMKKTLYVDLFGYDKIMNVMNIKNEKTNDHRVFVGLLDIHMFFMKQSPTTMCSYVEEWPIGHYLHFSIKKIVEYFICMVIFVLSLVLHDLNGYDLFKSFSRVVTNTHKIILKEYCV